MGVTNFPDGISNGSGNLLAAASGSLLVDAGIATITGAGTVTTNLTAVSYVSAQLNTHGTAAGNPYVVEAVPSGGDIVFTCKDFVDLTAATDAGTIHYLAFGS